MTAALFLVPAAALVDAEVGGTVDVEGAEARHAVVVRRLATGEPVDLADGRGRVVRGVVAAAAPDRLTVDVSAVEEHPVPSPRLILVQALAKGDRDELAIQAATELGVDEVVPWQSARAVVQWRGARGERSLERWRAVVREAAKQARRTWVPTVSELTDLRGLLGRTRDADLTLVLHADAELAISDLLTSDPVAPRALPRNGDVILVVGPEGGITAQEIAALTAAGGQTIRVGPHVLRSSTAGPAAIAALSVALSRW